MASSSSWSACSPSIGLLDVANRNQPDTQSRMATYLAREVAEATRAVPYDKVSGTGVATELQRLPGLENPDGGAYTLRRGGQTYTMTVDVCRSTTRGTAAARDPPPRRSAPTRGRRHRRQVPEDYKRVVVTASWRESGRARRVRTGIVNNPGSAAGPSVRTITPRGYVAPYVVTSDVAGITVDVTTSTSPDGGLVARRHAAARP